MVQIAIIISCCRLQELFDVADRELFHVADCESCPVKGSNLARTQHKSGTSEGSYLCSLLLILLLCLLLC